MEREPPTPRSRLAVILTVALVVLVAGAIVARPVYHAFKHWRALQLVQASAQALKDQDIKTAQEKADDAVKLWPDDARVARQEAKELSLQDPAAALAVWMRVWTISQDPDDLRGVIEAALATHNYPIAVTQFSLLQKARPQDPQTWLLEGKVLLSQSQYPEAVAALKHTLDSGNAPPEAHLLYAQAAVQTQDPQLMREGLTHLNALTERTDQLGLDALRLLGTYPLLTAGDAAAIVPKLQNHPLATRADKLLALHLESLQPGTDEAVLVKAARDLFPPKDPDALHVIGLWLMGQRQYQAVLDLIDQPTAFAHQDLFEVRADAMAALGQWPAIEQTLNSTDPKPPLPEEIRLLFEARALTQEGRTGDAQIAWQRAFNSVADQPDKLLDMALYAVKLRLDDLARPALESLLRHPQQMAAAYTQLVQIEHRAGNTAALHQRLEDMAKAFPDNVDVRNDVLYTGFLLGENGPEQLASAHHLVDDSKIPYLSYRVTLALGLLKANQPAEAGKVFANVLPSTWPTGTPGWNAVYIGVLRANGQEDAARRLALSVNADQLLPEEKQLLLIPIPASGK